MKGMRWSGRLRRRSQGSDPAEAIEIAQQLGAAVQAVQGQPLYQAGERVSAATTGTFPDTEIAQSVCEGCAWVALVVWVRTSRWGSRRASGLPD